MAESVQVQWKPGPGSPWVMYHVYMREQGYTGDWTHIGQVAHPRCLLTATGSVVGVGKTYEIKVLSSTRMNVYNSFDDAPITTFTVVDCSPVPTAPYGLQSSNNAGGGFPTIGWRNGEYNYYMEIWVSWVNDRETSSMLPLAYGGNAGAYNSMQSYLDPSLIGVGGYYYSSTYLYHWLRPKSYWGKLGPWANERFGGVGGAYIPPQPESHSR